MAGGLFSGNQAVETGQIHPDDASIMVHPSSFVVLEMRARGERLRNEHGGVTDVARKAVRIPSLPREKPVPLGDAYRFGDGLRLVGGVDALGEALLAEAAVAHLPPTFVST